MTSNASEADAEAIEYGNAVAWTAVVAVSIVHNLVCMHVVAEYTEKWKSSHMLIFSLVLTEFFNLTMPLAIMSIMIVSRSQWNTTSCQFLLWSLLTFRVVVALHQAFLALDRVWFLKWPSAYRVHFAAHRSSKTVVFIWLLSTLAGFMPILGWEDTRNADVQVNGKCHILLSDMGLGYAISLEILLLLTLGVGTTCILAAVVGIACKSSRNTRRRRSYRIPSIVIESETGERTPAFDGTIDGRTSNQVCLLVCVLVLTNYLVDGVPFVAINTYSLAHKENSQWMSLVIVWCNLLRSLVNPCLIQIICDRYRKGFKKTMGNTCCVEKDTLEQAKTPSRENSTENLKSFDNSGFPNHNFLTEEYCDDIVPSRDRVNVGDSDRVSTTAVVLETVQSSTKPESASAKQLAEDGKDTHSFAKSNVDSEVPKVAGDTSISERCPASKVYEKHKHRHRHRDGNVKTVERVTKNGKRGEKYHSQGKENFRDVFRLQLPTMESVEEESGESESEGGSEGRYSAKDIASVLDKEVVVEAQIEAVPNRPEDGDSSDFDRNSKGTEHGEGGVYVKRDSKVNHHGRDANEKESNNTGNEAVTETDETSGFAKGDRDKKVETNQSEILMTKNEYDEQEEFSLGVKGQTNMAPMVQYQETTQRRLPLKDTGRRAVDLDTENLSSDPHTSLKSPTKLRGDAQAQMRQKTYLKLNLGDTSPKSISPHDTPRSPFTSPPISARGKPTYITPDKLVSALKSAQYSVLDSGEIVNHKNEDQKSQPKIINNSLNDREGKALQLPKSCDDIIYI